MIESSRTSAESKSVRRWHFWRSLGRVLFYGSPKRWYLDLSITGDNRQAVVEWLDHRMTFHVWLTSIITGSIVFLGVSRPDVAGVASEGGVLRLIGLGLMLLSVMLNMICLWSLPNWKYHVRTGTVTEGTRMRLDLEVVAWLAMGTFLVGVSLAVLPLIVFPRASS